MPAPLHPELQIPRLPAEWEPHAALMLTWPHGDGDWGEQLAAVEESFEQLAVTAARFEPLLIVCRDSAAIAAVRQRLTAAGVAASQLVFGEAVSNDVWARDHGPITILQPNGSAQLLDFRFNGWGQRFPGDADDRITRLLFESGVIAADSYRRIDWVLEGGSIDSDGAGTLLTTGMCLLNENRNGRSSRDQVEAQLRARLGGRRIIWLESGWLDGDDTDGHVDMLARFIDAETIAYATCEAPQDPHYAPLQEMAATLRAQRTLRGEPYRLIELPLPQPVYAPDARRLPATYANFVFVNGGLLVPTYGDPADEIALQRLAAARPDRQVVGVPARTLIHQGGSLHCASMQLPAGLKLHRSAGASQ